MKGVMICLVGEQPVPNLLPIRHCKPKQVVLVYSATTKRVSENLQRLLKGQFEVLGQEVPPYDIVEAQESLAGYLCQQGWQGAELLFNLTGGTKPMALAAFLVAQEQGAPLIYFQSEGRQSLLYRYEWVNSALVPQKPVVIQESITIDDHLKAYAGKYGRRRRKTDGHVQLILDALSPHLDEIVEGVSIGPNIEIDLVMRCGNQVAVAEVTMGKVGKNKIDQLHSVCGREFLGTYTQRFLIVSQELESNNRALARAYNITVVERLVGSSGGLSEENRKRLVETVTKELGGRP